MSKVKCCELGRLADIDISGVDKKIKDKEQLVRLCNFVDVYYNWAISKETAKNFMDASANKNEVARFMIKKGQVALTKDSETREDIGTAAYIADNFERTLLGYHCALITPHDSLLKGNYLNAFLHTSFAQKHFANKAGGSGQRYTLTVEALSSLKVPLPSLEKQELIGDFFSYIDRKIENNKKINVELETMAKVIFDYWFLQFDFPNQEGKPYKSSGGKMVWREELKREIPEGWQITTLGEIITCHDSKRIPLSSKERENKKGDIPYYGATGIMDYVDEAIFEGDYVLMAEDGSVMNEKGNPILQRISGKAWVNNHAHVLQPSKSHCCKLIMMLLKDVSVMKIKTGSIQMKINQENMRKIVLPDIPEDIIMKVNQLLEPIDNQIQHYQKENTELEALRAFLLPLLMSGQVVFEAKN